MYTLRLTARRAGRGGAAAADRPRVLRDGGGRQPLRAGAEGSGCREDGTAERELKIVSLCAHFAQQPLLLLARPAAASWRDPSSAVPLAERATVSRPWSAQSILLTSQP